MRIYILNTTRFYHEDFEEYPGAWFSCPVDFEEVKERLGVQSEEEIEIEDYELPFPLEGNTRLWEINALCRMVQEMQGTPLYYEMDVVQKRWFSSFTEFIDHKDQIRCYPVQDGEFLARYLVQEVQMSPVTSSLVLVSEQPRCWGNQRVFISGTALIQEEMCT